MKNATHILIVEAIAADAELARREIGKVLKDCHFHVVETRNDFLQALEMFQADIILADYALPHLDGITALKLARKRAPLTPVIIWAGLSSEDMAVDCLKAGANNYVLKENSKRLGPAVIHALEERQLLLAHEQAEQKYRSIFENSMEGIFQSSPQGRYLKLNPAMARIYGYDSPTEMMRSVKDIATQIHVEPHTRSAFMSLLDTQNQLQNFEAKNYRKDGSIIWTSTSARTVCDPNGNIVYYEGYVQDITQRKQVEEALQSNEKRFRALIENGLDDISLLAVDGTLLWESPSTTRNLGYAPNEFVGRNMFELLHPEDTEAVRQTLARLLKAPGDRQHKTFRLRRADGTWRWVEAIGTNLLHEPGVNAIVVNYRDVTEQKQIEIELQQKNGDLALVNSLNEVINRGESLSTLVDLLRGELKRLFASDYTNMYLFDPDDRSLTMQNHSLPSEITRKIEKLIGRAIPPINIPVQEGGLFQRALHSGESLIISSPQVMQQWIGEFVETNSLSPIAKAAIRKLLPQIYKVLNIKSTVLVPLISDAKPLGVLNISGSNGYTEQDVKRVESICGHLTTALRRKQVEEALRESESRYQKLVETSHDLIWSVDAEGRITYVNRAAKEIYGYEPQELIGRSFFDLLDPDYSHPLEFGKFKEIIAETDEFSGIETSIRHRDGTQITMSANAVVTRDDEGNLIGITGTSRDITARKRVEEMLREERNLLRTLIDHIPDRIYAMDLNGRKTLSNTADWQASGGKTMQDIIGKTDFDTYPADLAEGFWQLDKAVLESGQAVVNYEEPGLDARGNRVSILTTKIPLRDQQGKVTGLVGIGRDITERKLAEARINDLLAFNEKILNHSAVGILTYAVSGQCVFANEKAASIVGTTVTRLMTQNFRTIEAWKKSGLYDLVEQAINTQAPVTEDIHHLSTFGKDLWMTAHCVTFKAKGEDHVLLSISDITERKQAEEKLRESENRYRLALKATNDVIWEVDLLAKKLFWSENAQIVFGYSPQEVNAYATWWEDHLHPDDRERVLSKLESLIAGDGNLWVEEYRFQLKGGSYAYISDRGYIERAANSTPLRMIGAMTDITERKQAEDKLRESENRLVMALSGAQMSVWEWDLKTNQIFWSPEFFKITGVDEEQFAGTFESFTDLIHSDDVDRVRAAAEKAMREQSLFAEEFRIVAPDGEVRWLSNLGRAEYDATGTHLHLIGTVQDVTQRKQAEIERQALLEIMQGLANTEDLHELMKLIHSSVAQVIYARNFFVVLYQPHSGLFEEIYTADEYDPPSPPDKLENSITSYVFRSGEPLLLTQTPFDELVKQGEMKLIGTNSASWLGVPLKTSGGTIGVMAVQDYDYDNRYTERDKQFLASIAAQVALVIKRKQAEEALRESEEHYRAIFEGVQDAIFVESLDGRILMVNQRACEMFGYSQEEFLTKTVKDLVPKGNLILMAEGENSLLSSEPHETLNQRANGGIFPIDISGRLQVINGETVLLVVVRDITERKQAEASLQSEREKMQNYLDIAGVMMLALDTEGTVTLINQKGCEILGFSTDEIIGKNWIKTFLPESIREEVQEVFQQLISGDKQLKSYYENSILTNHGEERLIAWHNTVVRDEQGKIISTLSSGEDITERKRSEEALREAETKYRTLVEQLPSVTYLDVIDDSVQSGEFNTSYISPQVENLLGYPPQAFQTDSGLWTRLIHPEDRERVLARIIDYYKNRGFYSDEYRMRTRKGNEIWVRDEAVVVRSKGSKSSFSQGVVFDITERKRSEAAEREQRVLAEALRDTAETLSSTLDYGEVLDHILMTVGRVVPHDAATILLIEGEYAHVVRSQGYDQNNFEADIMGIRLRLTQTTNLRQMLETRQPVVVYDTHTYPGWHRMPATDWLRSSVGAPISIYGEMIGFICLDGQAPDFFTPTHAERLEAFANQAALAIHNARLLQRAQEEIAERKRAEQQLRFEKERFESITATVPGIICSFRLHPDGSTSMPFASPAIQDVYGLLPSDVQQDARPLFERIHPEDIADVYARIHESASSVLPWHAEFRYQHPTKGETWIEGQSVPLREEDGSMIWHGFIHDVTERKRAEEELRASEERFRQLANNIKEVFWMTDAESGREIYMSPAAETIWGQPLETLLYESDAFINSVFPEDQPDVLQNIEKEKHGEKVEMEYRIVRPDGSLRWVWDRAFPIFDDSGRVQRIAGISADVTERRESELALIQSQSRYRELFDSSPVSIWEEDFSLVKKRIDGLLKNGVTDLREYFSSHPEVVIELASLVMITDANHASLELYNVEQKEDLLKSLTQALGEETLEHFQEEILGFLSPQKKFVWEGTEYRPDGKQVELVVTGSVPQGYEEDWSKVIVSIIDITDRKQAEYEIRRRAEENSILLKTSLALTNLDLKTTLQTVGDSAKNLFAADGCRIFLMEPDGKSLRCVLALQEDLNAFTDLRIKVGQGVTGAVAASGQAEIVNTMQNDARAVQVPGTPEEEEAIMFAPLKERESTIGVLSIRRIGRDRPFGGADLALLEALASMAASAVSNARLFAEAQRRLSELEALYENGLAVGRLLKPGEIGSRIINTFARYLPWHHVTIRLRRDASDDLELVAFSLPSLKEEERTNAEQHFIARINKVDQGLSGWVIQTGIPLRTGKVHDHPQYIDTHAGIQSGLYMPLKVGERVIGVISVESEVPDAFTEQDERLLATLGSQASIAFENARLYQAIEQELSERKRAQEALLISETHYRELADSITDILFELDRELRYTHWNKASEMLADVAAKDAIGKSMFEIFGQSQEQNRIREIYESVLKNRAPKSFETTLLVNGEKRSFDVNAYPSTRGVSVVAKDVTDRKRSEIIMQKRFELMEYSAHRPLEELMQRIVDEVSELTGSTIGFFHFVQEDQKTLGMQMWSTSSLKLFNVPLRVATPFALDQAGVWAQAVQQRCPLIQNDYEASPEKRGFPQGHVPITREIVIPIIRNERVMAIIGIGNKPQEYTSYDLEVAERLADYAWDITERKQMQAALEAERNQLARRVEERTSDLSQANSNLARALRVKDEFLANMSHELRTPLNAILGLSESLGEQIAGPLNEKQQKYITTIGESGHHLLSLINDILDLAKIEAGQITLDINKVDLHQVCQASLRMIKQLAQKKNQDVVLELGEGVGLMWADERRLKQMIVNLLGNAVKFTPESGKIGLEVHGDQLANKVTITVWDNGIGIKEDDVARLFQPFVQLDSGLAREATGTGLGLALVAQMARLHGGSVSAVSEPGKGSRFSIMLPWEPISVMDTASRLRTTGKFRAIKPDQKNKPTILLVEDTKEVVMMLRDYLELAGYKVVVAGDGVEAISQARHVHPDLILMDIMMPRLDGFEATRKLRSDPEFKYTPIIALTALAMPSDRERCLAAGMDEYISKPINLKALVRTIQSCLFDQEESGTR